MHNVSEMNERPKAKVPCLGCGKRDGMISPLKDKAAVVWCMRCGTLTDTESSPIDSLVPQLLVHSMAALGHDNMTSDDQRKLAQQPDAEEQTPAPTPEPAASPP